MEHPQGSQSADQLEFARIEVAELVVAFDQFGQLGGLARPFAGEHHPEILHRRCHPGIVEIDEMRRPVPPEDVAGVTVAMGPDIADRTCPGQNGFDGCQQLVGQGCVALPVFGRDEALPDQVAAGVTETLDIQYRTMAKRPYRAYGMNPAEHPAEDQQVVEVVELRRVPSLARVEGKAEDPVVKQALSGGVY